MYPENPEETRFSIGSVLCLYLINDYMNFRENPEAYLLHMVEDDGEVDIDFPPLDVREPISKFGFAKLSLVERTDVPSSHKQAYEVSV